MTFKNDFEDAVFQDEGGYGDWILIRHFDKSRRSIYWNDLTKESVGGPPYEYTDTVDRGIRGLTFNMARATTARGLQKLENVDAEIYGFRYFLRKDATIVIEDELFELDWSGTTPPTSIDYTGTGTGAKILNRYKVRLVIPYRGPAAEEQYKVVLIDHYYGR